MDLTKQLAPKDTILNKQQTVRKILISESLKKIGWWTKLVEANFITLLITKYKTNYGQVIHSVSEHLSQVYFQPNNWNKNKKRCVLQEKKDMKKEINENEKKLLREADFSLSWDVEATLKGLGRPLKN